MRAVSWETLLVAVEDTLSSVDDLKVVSIDAFPSGFEGLPPSELPSMVVVSPLWATAGVLLE